VIFMAYVIPVSGPAGSKEVFFNAFMRSFNVPGGCRLSQERLKGTGQLLLSRLDVTQINPAATELLGKTVYGDAIVFYDWER